MSPNSIYIIVSSVFAVTVGYDIFTWMQGRKFEAPEIRVRQLASKANGSALILGVVTIMAATLFHVNFLSYKPPVPFSEIDKITLKDFQGYRKPYQTLDGSKAFAFITTSLHCNKTNDGLVVEALFHPARSYVFNGNAPARLLLRHELYHFRITELFAREAREKLSKPEHVPSGADVEDVIDAIRWKEDEMQRRYDEESYHGYLMKEQKRWEKEVDSLLFLMREYENPIIVYE